VIDWDVVRDLGLMVIVSFIVVELAKQIDDFLVLTASYIVVLILFWKLAMEIKSKGGGR
jgi:flagellar biosynthesis component FlhA